MCVCVYACELNICDYTNRHNALAGTASLNLYLENPVELES